MSSSVDIAVRLHSHCRGPDARHRSGTDDDVATITTTPFAPTVRPHRRLRWRGRVDLMETAARLVMESTELSMAQMQFGRSGRIVVTMHTAVAASDEEWAAYLAALASWVADVDSDPVMQTSIVFTDGAAPSAEQRRAFVETMGSYRFLSAIVTTSRLTRGIVTALSWFTPGVRAFAPDDVDGILHHAQIGSFELPATLAMSSSFSTALGGVGVFETFAAACAARQLDAVG